MATRVTWAGTSTRTIAPARPTDFVPMSTYAGTMLQPKVLEQLWRTGDLEKATVAAGLPAGVPTFDELAYKQQPPRITFAPVQGERFLPAPGILWTVDVPNPRLELDISATMASKIASRRVIADEQMLELPPLAGPSTELREQITLNLVPKRRVRLAVEATSENQTRRSETIDLLYLPRKESPPAHSAAVRPVCPEHRQRANDGRAGAFRRFPSPTRTHEAWPPLWPVTSSRATASSASRTRPPTGSF